jgi:enoyl-CoA hydratase/carnithine racemase
VAPEGIQRPGRVVGPYRAERRWFRDMLDAEQALVAGMVDELVDMDRVALRARTWLEQLLTLPRQAMLQTRAIARADMIEALQPHHIRIDRFIDAWYAPDTQGALRALVAKLGK